MELYIVSLVHAESFYKRISASIFFLFICIFMHAQKTVKGKQIFYVQNYTEALAKKYSGELAVDENTPPIFLWHTADDGCVDVENTINMASSLSRHKVPFEMHIFDKGPHSLGMGKDFPGAGQWSALAFDWLRRMGF